MGHFTKHWPANLVTEVEDIVRECVSQLLVRSYTLLTLLT